MPLKLRMFIYCPRDKEDKSLAVCAGCTANRGIDCQHYEVTCVWEDVPCPHEGRIGCNTSECHHKGDCAHKMPSEILDSVVYCNKNAEVVSRVEKMKREEVIVHEKR